MPYQLQWYDGKPTPWHAGKVVCVGRNYADHAKELNNPIPDKPLLFIKPSTAIADIEQPLTLPSGQGEVHYEAEIALLVGETIRNVSPQEALKNMVGAGIALDLTLRDLQSELKQKGHPWEIAKAFDGSAPLSGFVPCETMGEEPVGIELIINGETRQKGFSDLMLTPIAELISYISHIFTLEPGDIILTGTPAGVGPLNPGDKYSMHLLGKDGEARHSVTGCVQV
ncbi:fumarylacetoacetate hydrolase family protein [Oceanospirillum sediminis]|uniref:Fumarylacetoacetate hydrolase family protein n=1 Tax=Oceanospirillum sediminis TaxID=2760088 RepID=A0A839IP45_9GAMM|nr:fumarylacetoacetate hydrolase family protein [Oceanospirillum sediminis]MBB1486718.1 fumarylacetoacetate hydrolase family protein [Oceanospirillum sediminis]